MQLLERKRIPKKEHKERVDLKKQICDLLETDFVIVEVVDDEGIYADTNTLYNGIRHLLKRLNADARCIRRCGSVYIVKNK